jgi:hypothetical protein
MEIAIGQILLIVPVLAFAGSLAARRKIVETSR